MQKSAIAMGNTFGIKENNMKEKYLKHLFPLAVSINNNMEVWADEIPSGLCDSFDAKVCEKQHKSVVVTSFNHGCFNSITDKRGIWGLTRQPRNNVCDSYATQHGKTYIGIIDKFDYKEDIQCMFFLIDFYFPQDKNVSAEKIISIFRDNEYGLHSDDEQTKQTLLAVLKEYPDVIAIMWNGSSVTVCADDVSEFSSIIDSVANK